MIRIFLGVKLETRRPVVLAHQTVFSARRHRRPIRAEGNRERRRNLCGIGIGADQRTVIRQPQGRML